MELQILILSILLNLEDFFLSWVKPVKGRIQFITMTTGRLEGDFQAIYDELYSQGYRDLHFCGMHYNGTRWDSLRYLFNCLKQNYLLKRASILILNDNNYLANCRKPSHLKVMQIWHSSGGIKKFGNQLTTRKYELTGYDKIITTSEVWRRIYSEAFNTLPERIKPTGLPRNKEILDKARRYRDHSAGILYAPTFRGNSIDGLEEAEFNAEYLRDHLPKGWELVIKRHPLSSQEDSSPLDTYTLMAQADILITDYSAVLLDYSLLNRPIIIYAPDIEGYEGTTGLNIDLNIEFKGYIAYNMEELARIVNTVIKERRNNSLYIQRKYMANDFRNPAERIVKEIQEWL